MFLIWTGVKIGNCSPLPFHAKKKWFQPLKDFDLKFYFDLGYFQTSGQMNFVNAICQFQMVNSEVDGVPDSHESSLQYFWTVEVKTSRPSTLIRLSTFESDCDLFQPGSSILDQGVHDRSVLDPNIQSKDRPLKT